MTLAELGERMTSREVGLWMARSRTTPLPQERADQRAAIIAHAVVCMNWADKNKRPPPISDFLVVRPPKPKMDGLALLAKAAAATGVLAPLGNVKE